MLVKRKHKFPVKSKKCFCCGALSPLSDHHIKPRDEGGTDESRNLVTLCLNCHDEVEGMEQGLSSADIWQRILKRKETFRIMHICASSERLPRSRNGYFLKTVDKALLHRESLPQHEHWSVNKKSIWGVDSAGVVYRREAEPFELAIWQGQKGSPDVVGYMSMKINDVQKSEFSVTALESAAA